MRKSKAKYYTHCEKCKKAVLVPTWRICDSCAYEETKEKRRQWYRKNKAKKQPVENYLKRFGEVV